MDSVKLSIIIVSWNVKKLLHTCLDSIKKQQGKLSLEIIVVDNGSHDGTVEMIKEHFPNIELIPNTTNLGFAAANNQGILKSRGQYILLLNPDTEIIRDALNKTVDFMERGARVGVMGCKHLNPDWTLQPSVRRFPTAGVIALIITKVAKIMPNASSLYNYLARNFDYKLTQPVDQVAGSFFMIRRQVIDEVGLFDENFFLWFEEVDFCKRTHKAGWEVWYDSGAEIIHHGGKSFDQQLTVNKQKQFFKSAWYYFQKHGLTGRD